MNFFYNSLKNIFFKKKELICLNETENFQMLLFKISKQN